MAMAAVASRSDTRESAMPRYMRKAPRPPRQRTPVPDNEETSSSGDGRPPRGHGQRREHGARRRDLERCPCGGEQAFCAVLEVADEQQREGKHPVMETRYTASKTGLAAIREGGRCPRFERPHDPGAG